MLSLDSPTHAEVVARAWEYSGRAPRANSRLVPCPFGDRHSNGDAKPSCSVQIWKSMVVASCFGCGARNAELMHEWGFRTEFNQYKCKRAEVFRLPVDSQPKELSPKQKLVQWNYYRTCLLGNSHAQSEIAKHHGMDVSMLVSAPIGYSPGHDDDYGADAPAMVYAIYSELGELATFQSRELTSGVKKSYPFNKYPLYSTYDSFNGVHTGVEFLVEGPSDALVVSCAGYRAHFTLSAHRMAAAIVHILESRILPTRLIVLADNDTAGTTALAGCRDAASEHNNVIYYQPMEDMRHLAVEASESAPGHGYKAVNDVVDACLELVAVL